MKKIGFWKESNHPEYPDPNTLIDNVTLDPIFMGVLTVMMIVLENDNKHGVRRHIDKWPDQQVLHTKGFSTCRICGCLNGTKEYRLGNFCWPEGYRHYLTEHNVKIDPEFKEFIIEYAKRCITRDGQPLIIID